MSESRQGLPPEELPDMPPGEPLAEEWALYKREARRLLAEGHEGQFILIKGTDLSIWPTKVEALRAGYERFGVYTPIFVHQLQAVERIYKVPRWA